MPESPRVRRLRSDLRALEQLALESSIFSFQPYGGPPDFYILRFKGRGFYKTDPRSEVLTRDEHEVHIRLGASYPRMMPELAWKTPLFHPNVSPSGVVCLGGYGTHWVPSLSLDELCTMLWEMIRYENYDETSPYNREAAAWAKNQTYFRFPIDGRPLRDKLVKSNLIDDYVVTPTLIEAGEIDVRPLTTAAIAPRADVVFLGDVEIIEAEIVSAPVLEPEADIVFIE